MKRIFLSIATFFLLLTTTAQTTLNEGFESWPPTGWQILELGAATDGWIEDWEGIYHSGEHSASSGIDNSQCDNWLISSGVNVVSNNYQLSYWEISNGVEYYDKASVLVSSGSSNPNDGDFIELYEANGLNTASWEERIIDLSAYEGETIYVAFRHEGTWHNWYVDDVAISPSSFTDGALQNFTSPIGVSETPGISPVIINVQNLGTTVINDFDIAWEVNNFSQTTYNGTGLNLQPGQSTLINLGDYNFDSEGAYSIEAELVLTDDFEETNNSLQTVFEISSFKDGAISSVQPEGMIPTEGNLDVIITVNNLGQNTIDIVEIEWTINGTAQNPFTSSNLNLVPGESREITIGQYFFTTGVQELNVTLHALGDINSLNDTYSAKVPVAIFWESFEGTTFPPEGWSINFGVRDNSNFGNPFEGEYYYTSSADDNYFGEVSDTLFTPLLDIENGDRIQFYIKTSAFTPGNHALIWKDGQTGDIHHIQDIANNASEGSWELRDLDISVAAGANYIGITTVSSGGYGQSSFDMFTSDASLNQYAHDLKIMEGDMYFIAMQNEIEHYECRIKNKGIQTVLGSNYTVKLIEAPNTELASVTGVDLSSWEEASITIPYSFTELSEKRLFFEIEYTQDENTSDNTFRASNVHVVPNTVEINEIGSPVNANLNFPFGPNGNTNTLGEDDMSQLLYYNDEFNNPGEVYGIAYKYDNLLHADKVVHYPLKVWIAQTDVENMDNGWLPNEELTLVFDGIIEILPGEDRDLYIPFNQPVLLNGLDNVVIQNYQYDPEWPPSIFRIFSNGTSTGPNRSIAVNDVYDLDPLDPPAGYYASPDFTFTRFVIDPTIFYADLSGTVYDATTNNPLADATVSIEGTSIEVQSNSNGQYTLPEIPYGSYIVQAQKDGFLVSTEAIELNESNQTQDFYLEPLPEIEVVGFVVGDNNTSNPLELVEVSIFTNDELVETTQTDENGVFDFPLIYGGSDYEAHFFMYGYYELIIPFTANNTNIDLGEIILEQEFISPFDVQVVSDTEQIVSWKNPQESEKVKLQNDLDVTSHSYTNEPYEDVWLGNIFEITEMTTLTSVEIKTDIYENATDYVTIDIFDVETNEIIASSQPFLIQPDAIQTIDIPNIVVSNTISAMIHWQNNPESTNALIVDYSDPEITNSAAIKYPGEPMILLSEFFGSGAPNMSFHVRVNTLDDGFPITNNEVLSYNVYRGLAANYPDISNWDVLAGSPTSSLSMIDVDASNLDPNEYYRYAVETMYTNGYSEVTFSNEILGGILNSSEFEILDSAIRLYPNPATDQITIDLGPNTINYEQMIVFDALGRTIMEIHPSEIENNSVTRQVTHLQSGMYFLIMTIEGNEINKKFIVD